MALFLNIFDGDAFSPISLTNYVNARVPFAPGFISGLGLYTGQGVYTVAIGFDEENGALRLIQSSPRGSAPSQSQNTKGTTRYLKSVRLAREAVITADQISGVRVLGTASQLQTAERMVYKRIEGPTGLKAELSATLEHLYLGGLDGLVIDADGSTVLWDLYDFYGLTRPATIEIDFGAMTADSSTFNTALTSLRRAVLRALNGMPIPPGARLVCLCGDDFFDAAFGNKETTAARKIASTGNANAVDVIFDNLAFDSFGFSKIRFVNYRGGENADGTAITGFAIPANEARIFMMGVPGLFQTFFSPADTMDFVNTEGLPNYMIQRRERQTESSRAFELQSNPLVMCMRPQHLRRLKIKGT